MFTKIIIPVCKPMLVYQALTSFLGPWLDFVMAKAIARTQDNYTVALGLYQMLSREYLNDWFARFAAAAVIISVPIAIPVHRHAALLPGVDVWRGQGWFFPAGGSCQRS